MGCVTPSDPDDTQEIMYNKRTFGKSMGASFAVLAVVAMITLSTGIAFAVPLSGIGGFTFTADEITAESVLIYPGASDTSNQGKYPMAVVEQKGVAIEGMRLTKVFNVDSIPGLSGNARLVMTSSGTTKSDQQLIKVSSLSAKSATFNQQVIDESNSEDLSKSFSIWSGDVADDKLVETRMLDLSNDGPAQVLTDANIQLHYLASSSLSVPGLSLKIQYDSDGDGTYNE